MLDVITLGETMVLMSPTTGGSLKYANSFNKQIGGAESNFAIGIIRLGHSSGWISKVGNDPFGEYLLSFIRGEGVDVSKVKIDNQAQTAIYFKEFHELKDPTVYYYRAGLAASRMEPEDLDEDYISKAKILHLTGITPALSESAKKTIYRAIEIAKKHNVMVSFDPNIRRKLWKDEECRQVLLDLITKADIVLPGISECEFLFGESNPERACTRLLSMGPKIVAIKLGKDGCIVADKNSSQRVKGMVIEKVVDSIGAGDGFDAGFITGILNNWDIEKCGKLANDVGGFVTTVRGDIEGLPTLSEIKEFRGELNVIDR
ncbi:sugar kinase [Clostridium psychrophilum]|uniref:sugar kinase n=1 Tax=Clostridium psychrophilum TaxID=132926 RepID=UPI001C0D043C|nr:sugar kinase [Clostridium psychrophilum]MBU3182266.1 sugar kinase [Clostridium psychrophilum]